MARFRVEGETIEEIRDELNLILKRVYTDLRQLKGEGGDVHQEAKVVMQKDMIFDKRTSGPVLKDNANPPRFWRLWISNGVPVAETTNYTPDG